MQSHQVFFNMAVVPEDTGYPMNWFKNIKSVRDTYECAVCLELVKDPVQVRDCGHRFCRYCLDRVLRSNERTCPSCREGISEETVFTDKAADREIRKLEVNCPSSPCEWNGSLDSLLKEHSAGCPFLVMNCSHVGCGIQVRREEFLYHVAHCEHMIVGCIYCKSEHVFKDKDAHLETCTHFPIECINKCSIGKVPRNKMDVHIETVCDKTIIKCKYSEFGCKHQCERHQMKDHLTKNMESHLDWTMMEVSRLKMVTTSPHIMVITDFNRKLSEAKENNRQSDIDGDPFFTSPGGYKLRMLVWLNDTREEVKDHLGIYIRVMKSDHDAILSWPFKKKCMFTLVDQQDNEEERKNIAHILTPTGEEDFKKPKKEENLGFGVANFVSHATLQTRKYIKDDTVFITLNLQ